jgi:hypothetical protein
MAAESLPELPPDFDIDDLLRKLLEKEVNFFIHEETGLAAPFGAD